MGKIQIKRRTVALLFVFLLHLLATIACNQNMDVGRLYPDNKVWPDYEKTPQP